MLRSRGAKIHLRWRQGHAESPPAPFTKPEERIPLAFRGGVRGLRLPSRVMDTTDHAVNLIPKVTCSRVRSTRPRRLPGLARTQHSLLRPAPREDDQLGAAPGSSRRLVNGLAPPASGNGTAAAPGSSRSPPTIWRGKWQSRYLAARSAEAEAAQALPPPQTATSMRRSTSSATRPSTSRSPAPSSASSSSGLRQRLRPRACAARRAGPRSPCPCRSG